MSKGLAKRTCHPPNSVHTEGVGHGVRPNGGVGLDQLRQGVLRAVLAVAFIVRSEAMG